MPRISGFTRLGATIYCGLLCARECAKCITSLIHNSHNSKERKKKNLYLHLRDNQTVSEWVSNTIKVTALGPSHWSQSQLFPHASQMLSPGTVTLNHLGSFKNTDSHSVMKKGWFKLRNPNLHTALSKWL